MKRNIQKIRSYELYNAKSNNKIKEFKERWFFKNPSKSDESENENIKYIEEYLYDLS